jgi:hypothetical protein
VPADRVDAAHADQAIAVCGATELPRREDRERHRRAGSGGRSALSGADREYSVPDCYVLFENVFVPIERVFLNGETDFSGALVDTLGIWERARVPPRKWQSAPNWYSGSPRRSPK